jgi:phage tail sheath protein FI
MGPLDSDPDGPVTINSFGDFQRAFGGLDPLYPMSYAVRDFYLNGGSKAIIVRLYKASDGKAPRAQIKLTNVTLEAASAGAWGNNLRVRIDNKVAADPATLALLGVAAATDLFNLTVRDTVRNVQETFVNVSVKESARRVDRVLLAGSSLLRVAAATVLPGATVPTAHGDPPDATTSVWSDPYSTGVAAADNAADSAALDDNAYNVSQANKTGIYALEKVDLFNLLCIPPDTRGGDTSKGVYSTAMQYCCTRRAMLIVDPPVAWNSASAITQSNNQALTNLGLGGVFARNVALFFPRLKQSDPQRQGQIDTFVPCGIIAGVMAQTDAQRGVWKAPAGIDAALNNIQALAVPLTNDENGMLNPIGVNCLRTFPLVGSVVWGSRTLRGADLLADEYKYIPVRRTALFIEESLYRGTQWVVFEPNDEPLWASIRLNVGAFMHNLFRQGAFQGSTPKDAYFVKCDKDTTTQNDIDAGIVNIVVGFAPLKPAEFVVIQLQQIAGQIQT